MSKTDNVDLIERYIYDVTRRLRPDMREDIGEELRTLIEDMAEEQSVEEILQELGEPAGLARKYRGDKDSLISGEYYDMYWLIMKIVLICAGAGLVVSQIISSVVQVFSDGYEALTHYREYLEAGLGFSIIVGALLEIFAIITIVFILLEKYKVKINQEGMAWSIEKLPEIPAEESIIKKTSMIVEIVFSVLFAVLYVAVPHLMGAWIMPAGENAGIRTIPIFNLVIWYQVLPLLLLTTALGILNSIVKLVQGCYNITVMIVTVVCNTVSFILSVIVFKGYSVWNPDFGPALEKVMQATIQSEGDWQVYWNTPMVSNVVLLILAAIFILDTGVIAYRTIKNR